MTDRSAFCDRFHAIADRVDDEISERDVENVFLEGRFHAALGYAGTGTDLRSEFPLPDDRRSDLITLDTNERVTTVYEFETTGRDLPPHESQLFGYMNDLRAEYGILTNGEGLRLYRRGRDTPLSIVALGSVTESEAHDLLDALRERGFDPTDPKDPHRFLADLEPHCVLRANQPNSARSTSSIRSGSKRGVRSRTSRSERWTCSANSATSGRRRSCRGL
ncbi:hypothetical protein BRC77_06025 [Halobacteriales archaeon QH_8_64_26]|nr:MAG: hypothetical protein BRC77_06025 [Halobacteriales archaeon QH_8_64_26]